MEAKVSHIDYNKKTVTAKLKTGEEITQSYDKIVLATGSLPSKLNIPGTELENVCFVKLFQHAQSVIDKLENDSSIKKVTVVGAGVHWG